LRKIAPFRRSSSDFIPQFPATYRNWQEKQALLLNALRGFCVCGSFLGAGKAKITVQGGVGGVQNDVTIRAIPQVFLDFAFN